MQKISKNPEEENQFYEEKSIEMMKKIKNQDYLFKIYHYILAKYRRENKEEAEN